ncbi:MAG TPA: DUF4331 family protein [Rubricoccaceae bacterium]
MRLSPSIRYALVGGALTGLLVGTALLAPPASEASSHREAPLIADDPLADNTDVYAFRTGDNVAVYANFIGLEDPEGGPNFAHFAEDVRYEIHIKNRTSQGALGTATDDITYRFTFTRTNEDPTTFFNIRLGAENLRNRYRLEKSTNGGQSFTTIVTGGDVPQANIGPRSNASGVGINEDYEAATVAAVTTAATGEQVFAGPRDDAFFVDLGGVFDLGNVRQEFGDNPANPAFARDGLAGKNVHTAALLIPISMLQKDGLGAGQADDILDGDFVIGVWASASRPQIRTLNTDGTRPSVSGPFVQVSRLGMPLTNEAIIPIGMKDLFNATTPYMAREQDFAPFFANPELALYMGNGAFGAAVPNLSDDLRIPTNSYPAIGNVDNSPDGSVGFNFNNGQDGVYDLVEAIVAGTVPASAIAGTAFAVPLRPLDPSSPTALAADNQPRRVDIFPIFYFGVPNLSPYQLATGKTAGPLSAGKPFINNFLPVTQTPDGGLWGGDMLRLNMAVPTTDRSSAEFRDWARLGLIRAAAIGLTAAPFNTTTNLEFIPHMDGFPNGRRLEDDVVGIELQAVGGVVLAAVGLPQDDAVAANYSDLASPFLLDALSFLAGPTRNDVPLRTTFPFMANPHRGFDYVKQLTAQPPLANFPTAGELGVGAPRGFILEQSFPNPSRGGSTIRFVVASPGTVSLAVYDLQGRLVQTLVDGERAAGTHEARWDASGVAAGTYVYRMMVDGEIVAARRATVVR